MAWLRVDRTILEQKDSSTTKIIQIATTVQFLMDSY